MGVGGWSIEKFLVAVTIFPYALVETGASKSVIGSVMG
jgi:hypothetical protein